MTEDEADKIKITLFKTHDDFAQSARFKPKQSIVFYTLWSIPPDVNLVGRATLTINGERVDGTTWTIIANKDLRHEFRSHHWGWDCNQKIPKYAKPGSAGAAAIELNINGFEPVRKTLTFTIAD